jgi:hypothetical protein
MPYFINPDGVARLQLNLEAKGLQDGLDRVPGPEDVAADAAEKVARLDSFAKCRRLMAQHKKAAVALDDLDMEFTRLRAMQSAALANGDDLDADVDVELSRLASFRPVLADRVSEAERLAEVARCNAEVSARQVAEAERAKAIDVATKQRDEALASLTAKVKDLLTTALVAEDAARKLRNGPIPVDVSKLLAASAA